MGILLDFFEHDLFHLRHKVELKELSRSSVPPPLLTAYSQKLEILETALLNPQNIQRPLFLKPSRRNTVSCCFEIVYTEMCSIVPHVMTNVGRYPRFPLPLEQSLLYQMQRR